MAKYYQVLEQSGSDQSVKAPQVYVVEDGELLHFLHENMRSDNVLVFRDFPERNLYTLSNTED